MECVKEREKGGKHEGEVKIWEEKGRNAGEMIVFMRKRLRREGDRDSNGETS